MTFPDLRVDDGDPYTVCTVSAKDFKSHCIDGKNSPLNRPEFVDINVGGGSNNANEDEDSSNVGGGSNKANEDEDSSED